MRGVAHAVGALGIAFMLCASWALAQNGAQKQSTTEHEHPPKHQARLAWNPPPVEGDETVHKYKIYRASASVNKGKVKCNHDWKVIATTEDASPRYTDEDVKAGKAYCYAVTAVRSSGESRQTPPVTAVIPSP